MEGRRLHHYEILARLGAGGMGEVWRAHDTRLDRDVAVKILRSDRSASLIEQERFLREARAASALIHPNIITVHEIDSAEGTDFIVMEYVRGESLADIIARGTLAFRQAVSYAIQICDALQAAHEAGVIHRDLKPGNIMVTPTGLVKVLDFGLAKRATDSTRAADDPTEVALTVAGIAIGTPAYMSPEQAVGDPVDQRTDLFSFGVLLYQMLTGVLPFQGATSLTVRRQIVHEPAPPVRDLAPRVPRALADVVERCLAKEPSDRYQNATTLGADLRAAMAHLDESAHASPIATAAVTRVDVADIGVTRQGKRRSPWALATLGTLVVIALAVGTRSLWLPNARSAAPKAEPDPNANVPAAELTRRATEQLHFYYREGNVQNAIQQLELALQQKSPYPLAEARLSLAYWRQNEISPDPHWQRQALAHAEAAVRGDSQLALSHIAHGAALSIDGDLDQAAAAYDQASTLDPANSELLWRLGDLAVARRDPASAERLYVRAVESAPEEWVPQARLGAFYYRQGQYQGALAAFEKQVRLAPDNARGYSNLAAVYHQLERTDEAAAVLQRSLEVAPNDMTYSNLGTLLYFQGRFPEALSAFERSVQLGANTYLRWGNLADAARLTSGGQGKAHEAYTRAIQLVRERLAQKSDDANARSSLATYLVHDGQAKDAITEIDRALAQSNLDPAVFFKGAIVYELAGQRVRALDLLRQALQAGYQLREVRVEPDLVNLRADAEYHRLASRYEKQPPAAAR